MRALRPALLPPLLLVSVLAGFRPCGAQEPRSRPVTTAQAFQPRSPGSALRYSLLGTLVPTATVVLSPVGLIVGPSLGYFYGGMAGRAWLGIGIRLAGVGLIVGAFGVCGWDCSPRASEAGVAAAMAIVGLGAVVASTIVDLASVKGAVRRHNRARLESRVSLEPRFLPASGSAGLGMRVTF